MALSPKLELRQSQSLVMTPQLMQAIKLLQLSHLDLIAYVDAELERNPLLERDEAAEGGDGEAAEPEAGEAKVASPVEELNDEGHAATVDSDRVSLADGLDTDFANVYPDDPVRPAMESRPAPPAENWADGPSRRAVSAEDYNLEAFVAEGKSLADHLSDQLGLAGLSPAMRLIGQALIDEMDDAGYLRDDLGSVAERLGAPLAFAEQALTVIQSFEPAGVGARDLGECLALQLRERDRLDPAMAALIANLDLVARRDYGALKRACGVDDEDLADMIAEIRALDPKPGHRLGDMTVQPVIPDVLVRPAPDGSWQIELNPATLPRVLVNQDYYTTVARGRRSDADKSFLSECLQTANWLVKSLDQRARTILKVAGEIVRQQDAFLIHGVQHLRPLNLKTVAEAISMHESTVSRVTSNKYMATPRGIFELKYFFTAAIASAEGGEAHSAEAVRFRIRRMIEQEPVREVLSDDAIVATLRESGIDIARRTVAKYREAMRIPSSVQRRREKQAAG